MVYYLIKSGAFISACSRNKSIFAQGNPVARKQIELVAYLEEDI